MNRHLIPIFALFTVGLVTGCGGGGSTGTTSVSGAVADGYLAGAVVFLDRNNNYRPDAGEASTTTDANGRFTLNIDPADMGKYPIVAMAMKGQTIDRDTNQTVPDSYLLSMPATAMSGAAGANFISPMSTLVREKMAANPAMTMTDAVTQLRNQMNLPVGVDTMANYMAAPGTGMNASQYQTMHAIARQMADLMAGQAPLVMNDSGAYPNRYRGMMATINSNMPSIAANVMAGLSMDSTFMTGMMSQMQAQLGTMPISGGFRDYSSMFRNVTGHGSFWNNTGSPISPMGGGMM